MFSPIVFMVFIAIFQNEIPKSFQSKFETLVPANETDKTSDFETSLAKDDLFDKPNITTKKNVDIDESTKSGVVTDIVLSESRGTEVTKPVVSLNNKTHTDEKVSKVDMNEDISNAINVHEHISSTHIITSESEKPLDGITIGDRRTNGNNNKDLKTTGSGRLNKTPKIVKIEPSNAVTEAWTADTPGGSTSSPSMNFIQRLAGRMIIPMFKAHEKFSGGLSKGVHGVREVGSGTIDIAAGTFNLVKDAARSILMIN